LRATNEIPGLSRARRRELVIDAEGASHEEVVKQKIPNFPSVAKAAINAETKLTQETAINKYLIVDARNPATPVIVDAIHQASPNSSEVWSLLKQIDKSLTLGDVEKSLERIKAGENLNDSDRKVEALWNKNDGKTGDIAQKVADILGCPSIVSKKSRLWGNQNANWWERESVTLENDLTKKEESLRLMRLQKLSESFLEQVPMPSFNFGSFVKINRGNI